jgi:hypothetical protein
VFFNSVLNNRVPAGPSYRQRTPLSVAGLIWRRPPERPKVKPRNYGGPLDGTGNRRSSPKVNPPLRTKFRERVIEGGPVSMASGSPTVGLRKLLLHKLSANFPAPVGLRVDIEVPPTALQLESLRIRKDRLPIDRTYEIATDRHHRRSALAQFGRPREMSGRGGPGEARIGYCPSHLPSASSRKVSMAMAPRPSVGGLGRGRRSTGRSRGDRALWSGRSQVSDDSASI